MKNKYLILAIMNLVPNAKFVLKTNDLDEIKWLDDRDMPSKSEIKNLSKELEAQAKLNETQKSLEKLCEAKLQEAKYYIAGQDINKYFDEEYSAVERALDEGNVNFFKTEALLLGTTVQNEFDKAKKTRDKYLKEYNNFLTKIRAFRRKVGQLIKQGEIDRAKEIIQKAWRLGAKTKDEDIKKLFEE